MHNTTTFYLISSSNIIQRTRRIRGEGAGGQCLRGISVGVFCSATEVPSLRHPPNRPSFLLLYRNCFRAFVFTRCFLHPIRVLDFTMWASVIEIWDYVCTYLLRGRRVVKRRTLQIKLVDMNEEENIPKDYCGLCRVENLIICQMYNNYI